MPQVTTLEFVIGGVLIDKEKIGCASSHHYIVEVLGNTVKVYLGPQYSHKKLGFHYGLDTESNTTRILGGGLVYTYPEDGDDTKIVLCLWNRSSTFGVVPVQVNEKIGELLKPEFSKQGINIFKVTVKPEENPTFPDYWRAWPEIK